MIHFIFPNSCYLFSPRLDKPTSGLLLVAKTKPAMLHLSRQFVERKVKKTYTAIVNGIPSEPAETSLSGKDAEALNVDVDPEDEDNWQLIDHTLDEKSAVTVWKPLEYVKSLKAADGTTADEVLIPLFLMHTLNFCCC
jgi:23S rRNA-/tRNA-specific pseudouridylate synthase